jgi:hypothetical protein
MVIVTLHPFEWKNLKNIIVSSVRRNRFTFSRNFCISPPPKIFIYAFPPKPKKKLRGPQMSSDWTERALTMMENNEPPSFQAGDVVLTTYGVGVIVGGKENDFYSVRLWRIPGRSIGSSALAHLQPSAVSRVILFTAVCSK